MDVKQKTVTAGRAMRRHWMATIWVTWTLAIITFAVYRVFDDPAVITAQTVAALSAVIGLPPIFVGLWKWAFGHPGKPHD